MSFFNNGIIYSWILSGWFNTCWQWVSSSINSAIRSSGFAADSCFNPGSIVIFFLLNSGTFCKSIGNLIYDSSFGRFLSNNSLSNVIIGFWLQFSYFLCGLFLNFFNKISLNILFISLFLQFLLHFFSFFDEFTFLLFTGCIFNCFD